MDKNMRNFFKSRASAAITGIAIVVLASSTFAADQAFPSKPIRMVVGSVPGSAPDVLARIVGQFMGQSLGQTVVVDNRSGATGTIAAKMVSEALPDGYTLYTAAAAIATTPSVMKLSYDVRKDFAAVGQIASVPLILVVPANVAAQNVKDLIGLAKVKSGNLFYATPGPGGLQHLVTEFFSQSVGIKMVHVPYKGGALAVTGLLSGEAQLFFSGMPPALPLVRQGRLRALAVTTAARSIAAPEVPTMAQAGLPGFEADNWHGILAPAKTPSARIKKINQQLMQILGLEEIKQKFLASGAEPRWTNETEFQALINREVDRWAKLAREVGLKPQ